MSLNDVDSCISWVLRCLENVIHLAELWNTNQSEIQMVSIIVQPSQLSIKISA